MLNVVDRKACKYGCSQRFKEVVPYKTQYRPLFTGGGKRLGSAGTLPAHVGLVQLIGEMISDRRKLGIKCHYFVSMPVSELTFDRGCRLPGQKANAR